MGVGEGRWGDKAVGGDVLPDSRRKHARGELDLWEVAPQRLRQQGELLPPWRTVSATCAHGGGC